MFKKFVYANKKVCLWLFEHFPHFFYEIGGHKAQLRMKLDELIAENHPKKIMDVGSANRPMLDRSPDYFLTGLDIEELDGCQDLYDAFVVQSIEKPVEIKQDLIYSNAVLEHVPDNKSAVQAIYESLNSGGTTAHYFPCKNHPYALILRVVGKRLQKVIIRKLRPWASLNVTGYPTYFDYCSPGQMSRLFRDSGFEDIEVQTLYRANSYFQFFFPLYILVTAFENLCGLLNLRFFGSGAVISARRN
jgi:hypothetical protein